MSTSDKDLQTPIIIAHRGAQSVYPEHTLEGYQKAIELGTDYIEPDLVMTKDGVLIARHEPYISGTTNIAEIPEFSNKKTKKIVDGVVIHDWFVSDFTLAEIKKVRTRQSWKNRSQLYNDQFEIPTFGEILTLAKSHTTSSGQPVGIYPELKHPTFHKNLGLPMEDLFLDQITQAGLNTKDAFVFVQCFEVGTLQYLREKSDVKLIQLIGAVAITDRGDLLFTHPDGSFHPEGKPYDFVVHKDPRDYGFFATEEGMKFVASYADGIGPWKPFILPIANAIDASIRILPETDFVERAHRYGLQVHPYTFRNEDTKWTVNGEVSSEYELFFKARVDGVFSDYTDIAVAARKQFLSNKRKSK